MMRCFNILAMMVMLLLFTILIVTYSAHSNSQGPEEKAPAGGRRYSRGGRLEKVDESVALQGVVVIPQVTEDFLLEMTRRMEAVKNECQANAGDVLHESVVGHIAADTMEKFLYCVVPHPASGARLAYQLQLSDLWNPEFDDQGALRKNRYPPPKDFNLQQQEQLFDVRFLVTRHPLQRLLDSYTSQFENGKKAKYYEAYGKKMVTFFRERPRHISDAEIGQLLSKVDDDPEREQTLGNLYANPKGPTFTEFVQYVVNSTFADDTLWRPIHEHCDPCSIHYNYILSFEDLDTEGDQLMLVQKASLDERPKKESVFAGLPSEEASCSYFSQLNNRLMLRLMKKYDRELRMFSYSKDLFMRCADEYVQQ